MVDGGIAVVHGLKYLNWYSHQTSATAFRYICSEGGFDLAPTVVEAEVKVFSQIGIPRGCRVKGVVGERSDPSETEFENVEFRGRVR